MRRPKAELTRPDSKDVPGLDEVCVSGQDRTQEEQTTRRVVSYIPSEDRNRQSLSVVRVGSVTPLGGGLRQNNDPRATSQILTRPRHYKIPIRP